MQHRSRSSALLITLAVLVALSLASTAAAQTPSASGTQSNAGKITFTMGTVADMVAANPFKACCGSEYEMMFLAYDMLFNFGEQTMEPVTALAYYPPEQSADGKTWTFKVREGVKWSDGVPLTAKDIAFTYNFINEKKIPAFREYLGDPLDKNAFEAPDDTTLIWHMDKPTLSPLAPPWVPILPEHIWSKFWKDDFKTIKEFRNVPAVGSGPFVLTEWVEGRYWKMEANKDYWMGAPTIDEIVFRVYDTSEALKLALVNGEVDAAEALPPSIFQSLRNQKDITLNVSAANYFDNLAFNFAGTGNPALQNDDVRLAIAYAINRQALVDRVTLGYGSVGNSVVLPVYSRFHWQPTGSEVIGYDPDKAKSLLDQAGYKDTNSDGLRETPQGGPLEMQVLTISDVTYSVPEGKLVSGWLNDVGIKSTVKTVSESKAYDVWAAQTFDMYVWGWGGDPDPDFILSIFTTDQCLMWSDGCYSDPTFDKMYEQQKYMTDENRRIEIVKQMEQYLYEKNPEVILLYENDLQAYRNDRFTGFVKQPQPQGSIFYAFGPYTYLSIKPVVGDGSAEKSSGGTSPVLWIVVVVALAAIVAAAVLMRVRRGRQDTE